MKSVIKTSVKIKLPSNPYHNGYPASVSNRAEQRGLGNCRDANPMGQ